MSGLDGKDYLNVVGLFGRLLEHDLAHALDEAFHVGQGPEDSRHFLDPVENFAVRLHSEYASNLVM
jgi:hypothetical protein